ncbi:Uncharacterised protein [Pandoraea pulmonicola]|uniref:Uncharacterized protein n=1 Tax=Pandoraea pulmonicola TaxID=93221 RepID=A0AAJ4ZA76_PANPU|nr:Uncharacterised protein [Pandoraea pulmonicola]
MEALHPIGTTPHEILVRLDEKAPSYVHNMSNSKSF